MKIRTTLVTALVLTALAAPVAKASIPANSDETVSVGKTTHLRMTHRIAFRSSELNLSVVSNLSGASANAIQGVYSIH